MCKRTYLLTYLSYAIYNELVNKLSKTTLRDLLYVSKITNVGRKKILITTGMLALVMSAFLQLISAYGYHRTIGVCKILVSFITCIFCGSLTYTAIFTIEYSIGIGERTESLFFFMWPFHLCLAIGLGLSSLVAFLQTIEDVHKYIKGDHFRETVEAATDV